MAEAAVADEDPIDHLESVVKILKTRRIHPEKEISQIKKAFNGKKRDKLQGAISVIIDVITAFDFIKSENEAKKKIIGVVKIASLITPCLSPLLGPLAPIAAVAGPLLGLLSKFLRYIWEDTEDISKLLATDLGLAELKHEMDREEGRFKRADNYLRGFMDHEKITKSDISDMMSTMNIQEGVEVLERLKSEIELLLVKRDILQGKKAIHYVAYYVRIAALRCAMLGQMYAIATSVKEKSANADAIKNVIEGENEECANFLQFLTKPKIEYATFFALFDLSEYEEIEIFMKSLGLEFQNLNKYLDQNIIHIHTAYTIFSPICLKVAWNPLGNTWGCRLPNDLDDPPLFCFRSVSKKDNLFLISNLCDRYVYMKDNGYCVASYTKPGPEGIWKVIKLEDGRFLLCTKKGRAKFLYMERGLFQRVKGLDLRKDINERVLWKIENMENFDYRNVTLWKGLTKYKMIRPAENAKKAENAEKLVSKVGTVVQYKPKEDSEADT